MMPDPRDDNLTRRSIMPQSEQSAAYSVLLRYATIADLSNIMTIEYQCFSSPWRADTMRADLEGPKDRKIYLALEVNGELAGYIGAHYYAGEAHITTLAVDPQYQRMGLGELLVLTLMSKVVALGGIYVTLEYRASNRAAERLYAKLGLVPVRIRKNYYQDTGEDAVVAEMSGLQEPERRQAIEQLAADWRRRHQHDVRVRI